MKKIFVLLSAVLFTAFALTGCTTVVTQPQQDQTPANITLTDLSVSPQQSIVNEKVRIRVELTNSGGMSGTYAMNVKIDGVTQIEEDVTVGGHTITPVVYSVSVNTPGSYIISVGDRQAAFTALEAAK